ncbi:MAG TPA: Spy/CpxP family protein refolding chaperone [Rhodoferax sp.]|nr:Spy/CpxP family protein refolding chaperone [Rhodoferax sp.]HPW29729.1 Spy/CpxP family protein refolding chaperone [Rhodoferax sp.]
MTSGIKHLVIAGLLASAGFATVAQPMGPGGGAGGPMMGASSPMQQGGKMGMRGKGDSTRMEAMMAKRQADLKAKLKLAPEQEAAWTTFTTAMKPPAAMDHKRPDRAEMDKLTTPERIDKMRALRTEHMTAMNAAMDKREEATKTLYAGLNADQKKIFDAEHARMGDHHGGRRGGQDGHGMGMRGMGMGK